MMQSSPNNRSRYLKICLSCLLILAALFGVLRFIKIKYIDPAAAAFASRDISFNGEYQGQYLFDSKSGTLTQAFEAGTDVLWGIELQFERHQGKKQGELSLLLVDEQERKILQESIPVSSIENGRRCRFIFNHIEKKTKGKVYRLTLKVRDMDPRDSLAVLTNINEKYIVGQLTDHTGKLPMNLLLGQVYGQSTYLSKVFILFAAAVLILIYGLYYFVILKKSRMELVFLATIVVIGMVYVVMMKPGSIPDEPSHYRTAYTYSNWLLRRGNTKSMDQLVMLDDRDYPFYQSLLSSVPAPEAYKDLAEGFLHRSESTGKMISTKRYPVNAPWYLYAGSALGITLGRLAGFNGLTVFYLGRILNLLYYSALAFWAMKKIPFYKMGLFAVCLLPMTTQLTGSLSYDSIILGITLLMITHILAYAFKPQSKGRTRELIPILICAILLGGCKGGAYIPLCGLLFLIKGKRFASSKIKWLFVGGTALGTLLLFMLTSMTVVSSSVGDTAASLNGEPLYTISWIFQNPGGFIHLLSNTLFEKGDFIFASMLGKDLGWLNVPVQLLVILGFLGVFLLSAVRVTREQSAALLTGRQKIGVGTCIALSGAMIAVGIMISWTPLQLTYIEGIQGRYLIPLLLPLILCLKNSTLVLRKSLDRKLIFTLGWLHVLTFTNILAVTVDRLLSR